MAKYGRKPWVPRGWPAYLLSAFKYLFLLFFLYITWFALTIPQVISFLQSPYNRVSDIKMLLFFLEPSQTTMVVLALLTALSLAIPNFWCRFACPYGAMLGIIGKLSPTWLHRDQACCTQCGACRRACMNGLDPSQVKKVTQEGCSLCLACQAACAPQALGLETALKKPLPNLFCPRSRWRIAPDPVRRHPFVSMARLLGRNVDS
ncbi:4Fe-4S binding protein [Heliobacterium gestii]|uniref:4Fe-4S binding protein n=1 Tax=Heliomicrobium gestii TaxID=2699 RepID=A0A845L7P5_HELGE|nr:4Fe-4S binding protein [Heliomicrobium gestii]MBM7866036.1 polyferredoxin [Heliomicrobium gestii]MZP42632.1 4Fe-4S binding protein [Heliomicrobium gestii]